MPIERFKYYLTSITIVAFVWVLLFELNDFLFSELDESKFINWIFLPAGLRLTAILLFNFKGVVGLLIGALITSSHMEMNFEHIIMISLISAFNPYFAFKASNYLLKIQISLKGLTSRQLLLMSFIYAVFNSLSHNIYFYFFGITQEFLISTLQMFTGDLLGSLLILYTFSLSIKLVRKIASSKFMT